MRMILNLSRSGLRATALRGYIGLRACFNVFGRKKCTFLRTFACFFVIAFFTTLAVDFAFATLSAFFAASFGAGFAAAFGAGAACFACAFLGAMGQEACERHELEP